MGIEDSQTREKAYQTQEKAYQETLPQHNPFRPSSQHGSQHSSRSNSPTYRKPYHKKFNMDESTDNRQNVRILQNEHGQFKFIEDYQSSKDLHYIQFSGKKSELPSHHLARFEAYLKLRNLSKNLPEDDIRGELIIQRFGLTLRDNAQTWYDTKVRVFEPEDDCNGFSVPRTIKDWNQIKDDFLTFSIFLGKPYKNSARNGITSFGIQKCKPQNNSWWSSRY
jgi:hypothetical protein